MGDSKTPQTDYLIVVQQQCRHAFMNTALLLLFFSISNNLIAKVHSLACMATYNCCSVRFSLCSSSMVIHWQHPFIRVQTNFQLKILRLKDFKLKQNEKLLMNSLDWAVNKWTSISSKIFEKIHVSFELIYNFLAIQINIFIPSSFSGFNSTISFGEQYAHVVAREESNSKNKILLFSYRQNHLTIAFSPCLWLWILFILVENERRFSAFTIIIATEQGTN